MTDNIAVEPKETGRKRHRIRNAPCRVLTILLAFVIIIGAVVCVYARYTKTHYKIHFYQETSGKVSDNIRVAVISDLHGREYGEGAAEPDLHRCETDDRPASGRHGGCAAGIRDL